MRRTLSLAAALTVTLLAAGCGAGEPSRAPDVVGADVPRAPAEQVGNASLAAGLNRFGFEFHRLLTARSPGENVVFSPLSIGMAFGMADAGARGETAGQIEDVFHLPGSGEELHAAFNALDRALADAGKSTLRLANRMYPATGYPLVPEFVQTLRGSYGPQVEAPMMHNAQLQARYVDTGGYEAVELPYGDGELSMLVVVPEEGRFADFERRFDAERLAGLEARLRRGIVDLFLPRWSASTNVDLLETLPKLGLELPFDQTRADFTGISPRNPFIGAGVHAADIEVDEWGTVAAAATAIGFRESAVPTPDAVIRADRPFLYLIRHAETGAVLFLGRVVDP